MGSVKVLTTRGDNDSEAAPGRYYRHYLYCDACGSFELDPWLTPSHWKSIEKTRRRLGMAALFLLPVAMVGAWFASGHYPAWMMPLAGLIAIVGLLAVREALGSRIDAAGMRCRQCESTYPNGSPFFTDCAANPRNLTVADVPRPLGSSPYSRGASAEHEPAEP